MHVIRTTRTTGVPPTALTLWRIVSRSRWTSMVHRFTWMRRAVRRLWLHILPSERVTVMLLSSPVVSITSGTRTEYHSDPDASANCSFAQRMGLDSLSLAWLPRLGRLQAIRLFRRWVSSQTHHHYFCAHTSVTRFIKAEGSVSIVIKPLEAALASNDHIYAVVGFYFHASLFVALIRLSDGRKCNQC